MKTATKKFFRQLSKHPLLNFIGAVVVVIMLIIASYFLRTKETAQPEENTQAREVAVQGLNDQYLTLQGQVQKEGVVQVMAQTSGVVQKVNVRAGQEIKAKTSLLSLSTNYNGANAAGLQTKQALLAYEHNKNTIDAQKELIALSRKQADYALDSSRNSIEVNRDSINALRDNLNLTRTQLENIDKALSEAEKNNADGSQNEVLSELRGGKMGLLSGLVQLESSLRTVEFQTKEDTLATEMPDVAHDAAVKQLELQEKALDLQLESSKLSLQLAQVQASLMNPVSPLAGIVQKVNVKVGDLVSPGQVLAVINNEKAAAYIEIALTAEAAMSLDMQSEALLTIEGETYSLEIAFVSQVPVSGSAYQMQLALPEELAARRAHKAGVEVKLPMRVVRPLVTGNEASESARLINIDAIYQTQQNNYLYVVETDENGQTVAGLREVTLGKVLGSQVEVKTGLSKEDRVILNRQVTPGEKVAVSNI